MKAHLYRKEIKPNKMTASPIAFVFKIHSSLAIAYGLSSGMMKYHEIKKDIALFANESDFVIERMISRKYQPYFVERVNDIHKPTRRTLHDLALNKQLQHRIAKDTAIKQSGSYLLWPFLAFM